MRTSIISALISSVLSVAALADPPIYSVGFNTTQVAPTDSEWVVGGFVVDSRISGFDGLGVRAGQLICWETGYGDADVYRIASVVTQTETYVQIQVTYRGTNGAPRAGGPTFSQALIADAPSTNMDVPLVSFYDPNGPSPYLRDVLARRALLNLSTSAGSAGPQGPEGPAGPAGSNGLNAILIGRTNVVVTAFTNDETGMVTNYFDVALPSGTTLPAICALDPTTGATLDLTALNGAIVDTDTNLWTGTIGLLDPDNGQTLDVGIVDGLLQSGDN